MELTQTIAPFVRASNNVFKQMLDLGINKGQAEPEGDSFISQGFTVMIGLTGGWHGWFFLDMSQDTAMKLAGIMTGEEYETVENEEVLLAGAEIANIISGNAITDINNIRSGLNIRLTPPSVFAGEGMSMFNVRLNACSVLLQTDAGNIKLNVVMKEAK
ncbi:chemotaxis protein CheX [Syntrophomonas curvata]